MKSIKLTTLPTLAGTLILVTGTAQASPAQYQFYGVFGEEMPLISPPISASQYPVPTGTIFSGAFNYDSSTPISSTTNLAHGSFSNLVGTIGDNSFSSTNGSSYYGGGFFIGDFGGTSQPDNFVGFSANGFTLTGLEIGYASPSSNALPSNLSQTPYGIRFEFSNNSGTKYFFTSSSAVVNSVPIPNAMWLFGSGLLSLVTASWRQLKKH